MFKVNVMYFVLLLCSAMNFLCGMDTDQIKVLCLTIKKSVENGANQYSIDNNDNDFCDLKSRYCFNDKASDIQVHKFKLAGIGVSGIDLSLNGTDSVTIDDGKSILENMLKNNASFVVFTDNESRVCGAFSQIQAQRLLMHSRNISVDCDASLATANIISLRDLRFDDVFFQKASKAVLDILRKFKKQYDDEGNRCSMGGNSCHNECYKRSQEEIREAEEITQVLQPLVEKMRLKNEKKVQEAKILAQQQLIEDQQRNVLIRYLLGGGSLLVVLLSIIAYQKFF